MLTLRLLMKNFLVCPKCTYKLIDDTGSLTCCRCRSKFGIVEDGVAIFDHAHDKEHFFDKHSLSTDTIVLALMPGSRQQEVNRHLKTMIKTVELVKKDIEISAIVGKAPGVELSQEMGDKIHIETDIPEMALKYASLGIVSSGTVSLQSAIYGVPSVVIYKMNPLTWIIANKVTQVSFASMTNLIAKEQVLPELLQNRARPEKIADCLKKWLRSEDLREQTVNRLSEVKRQLGGPGASKKVARLILERLETA